jgi:hypothetical protein
MRNASFRLAKDSFRFRCFWGLLAPEAKRRESFILRSGAERRVLKDEVFEMETEGAKELRKSAANPLKSLARVNSCAGVRLVGWRGGNHQ